MSGVVPDPLYEQMKNAVIEGNGDLLAALVPVLLGQGRRLGCELFLFRLELRRGWRILLIALA